VALSGGYWSTLAEVLKLTVPTLIPGVVDENFKRGNPVDILPFAQANHTGEEIRWNREATDAEGQVANIGIGGATSFTEGVTYTQKSAKLKACYIQNKLDKFNPAIHQTMNAYEEIMAEGQMKAITKKLGDKIIYDDCTYDSTGLSMYGIHAWAAANYGSAWDIDMAETALALEKLRVLSDEMIQGVDLWLMPFCLARRIDAAYREYGTARLASATAGALGLITYQTNTEGGRTTLFDGKPIVRSDFMVAEQVNTGMGSDARAKYTSGTKQYSIFGIKLGTASLAAEDPGLKVAFGKTENDGEFWNLEYFEKLENWIGKAMRLSAYTELIPGSKYCIGRILDITDAAVSA
jgi:hypothetical protein